MRATPRLGVSLRDLLPEELALDQSRPAGMAQPRAQAARTGALLVVEKLVKEYPAKGAAAPLKRLFRRGPALQPQVFRAVEGISFSVGRGESVGLVGESGCGKSTTSTMLMRLIDKTEGAIIFDGGTSARFQPGNSRNG
jgi:peptide/nickel transport system ATP-binding protein